MLRWKLGWMLAVCLFALPGLVVEADARRVRLGIPFPGANMLTFYVGKDKGYFAEEGLEVEMILMRSPVANLALIAGELHFTAIPTSALTSALRGSGLKTFSAPVHRPIFWLRADQAGFRQLVDFIGEVEFVLFGGSPALFSR